METTILSTFPLIRGEELVLTSSNNPVNTAHNSQVMAAASTLGIDSSDPSAALTFEAGPHSASTPVVEDIGAPADGELSATNRVDPQPPPPTDPHPAWQPPPEPTGEWGGEREDESQDDDSTDEEDYPFWANVKEDTSTPDGEELKAIEEKDEVNALARKSCSQFYSLPTFGM